MGFRTISALLSVHLVCFGSSLPAQDLKLIFPQIAEGGGITLEIILTNASPQQDTGTIFFWDSNGQPLALTIDETENTSFPYSIEGGGVLKIQTSGTGKEPRVGYAT